MLQELERRIAPVTGNAATCHRGEYPAHPCASDIPMVVARQPGSVGTQIHDDATELAALRFDTNAGVC